MTSVQEMQVYPKLERRKLFRIQLTDHIKCKAIPISINAKKINKEEYTNFRMSNLSGGGTNLRSSTELSFLDGAIFDLSFDFNNNRFTYLSRIQWENRSEQDYIYGVQFINVLDGNESLLIRCLNSYEANKVNAQSKLNLVKPPTKLKRDKIKLPFWLMKTINNPVYLILLFATSMFLAELLIMKVFPSIHESRLELLDAVILTIILTPALYLFFFHPMKLHLLKRIEVEEKLIKLYRDQEKSVDERTAELTNLNQLLNKEYIERLTLSEEKYRNVVENLGVGVAVLGSNMEVLTINNKILQWHPFVDFTKKSMYYEDCYDQTLNDGKERELVVKREIGGEVKHLRKIASPIRSSDAKIVGLTVVIEDITDRKQREDKLHSSEEKYRQLFNQVSDFVFVFGLDNNMPSEITEVNDFTCKKLGFNKEDFYSMTLMDLVPPELLNTDQLRTQVAKLKESGVTGFESTLLTKHGDRIKVEVSCIGFFLNHKLTIISICHDITKRKETEKQIKLLNQSLEERINKRTAELIDAERKYRSLVQQSSDGIFIMDPNDLTIQEANYTFLLMVGYTEAELAGMGYYEINVTERSEVDENIKELKNNLGQTTNVTRKYKRKDGTFILVDVSASLIRYGATEVLLLNIREITKRIQTENALRQSYINLKHTLEETVNALVFMLKKRDPYSAGHMERVAKLSKSIAKEMGLHEKQVEAILIAGMLHDIGKIDVPADILNKPGKLTDNEMGIIKVHSQAGYEIIEKIPFEYPIAEIILQHHERLNGSGYPRGLVGDGMLLEAKIIAVADVVEAMASHRPYRPALGLEQALEEINKNKGLFYDPEVVEACLTLFQSGYQLERGVRKIS